MFPISNWTELDVWQYLAQEGVPWPILYFAHSRRCFVREGVLYAASEFVRLRTTKPVFFDPYQDNRTTGSGGPIISIPAEQVSPTLAEPTAAAG